MDLHRRRPRIVSTVLAVLLALESVAAVSAAASTALAQRSAAHALPDAAPAGEVLAETGGADRAGEPVASPAPVARPDIRDYQHPRATVVPATVAKATTRKAAPKAAKPTVKTAPSVRPAPRAAASTRPRPVSYTGTNHVWIPSLGVNRSVAYFSCTRTAPPDNLVYRWGCAGANNVYLMGHASGVFQPLHDAYLNGRLRVGMKVYYADGSGTTHVYAVKWWKLTLPTTDASWAWAAQAVPSMTLQTCMGANSTYRLIVRLVQVG